MKPNMKVLTIIQMLITIILLSGQSHGQEIGTSKYERMLFSDSIWTNNMDKTNFKLSANDGGIKECGVICSVRKDNCPLFMFDLADGTCTIAKEKGDIDWSDRGAENTLVYVKTKRKGDLNTII